MKSIVKQFLSYRYHHPRRLFSTNVVTGHPRRLFSTNEVTGSSTSDGEDNKASDDDDDNVKEENSEDNDKHLKKISIIPLKKFLCRKVKWLKWVLLP